MIPLWPPPNLGQQGLLDYVISLGEPTMTDGVPSLRDACKVCERAITEFVEAEQPTSTNWVNLCAARQLARMAIHGVSEAEIRPPRLEDAL